MRSDWLNEATVFSLTSIAAGKVFFISILPGSVRLISCRLASFGSRLLFTNPRCRKRSTTPLIVAISIDV